MAPHHFPVHSNKLWFHVNNEITLISAKFSVTLYNQHTSCKTVARCLTLYDALTTTQASIASSRHSSMTSFFIVVHFTYEMAYLLLICGGFWGIWPPKCGRHSCRPQKGTRSFNDCEKWFTVRENPHLSRRVREKMVLYVTYLPRRTLTADWHKFWVTRLIRGRNQLCKVLS